MKTMVDSSKKIEDVGTKEEVGDSIWSQLESEINNEELKAYAKMVDDDYENEMISAASDWSEVTTFLISSERISYYYRQLQIWFPSCHLVFATLISTSYCTILEKPAEASRVSEEESIEGLQRKHRTIL